jgi:hypothetical protein
MHRFWFYFGSKYRAARDYGPPQREHVIEPLAGAAGYSCYWEPQRVTLIDKDPLIVALWRYLQRVSAAEIMAIPTEIDHVDELPAKCGEEARWLVGFWLKIGQARPAKQRSRWANERYERFWSQSVRRRIASQVGRIRHWTVIEGSWEQAPDVKAHWHVDPPYQTTGQRYRYNDIDRAALANWCRSRKGFVQVCESIDADWLPFEPLSVVGACKGFTAEAVFECENETTPAKGGPIEHQRRTYADPRQGTRPDARLQHA